MFIHEGICTDLHVFIHEGIVQHLHVFIHEGIVQTYMCLYMRVLYSVYT